MGAEWLPPDRCCFRVWAPRSAQVVLLLLGPDRQVPMQPGEHGWHEVTVEGVQPGRHIATLESLCQKLEGGRNGDTNRRDSDRGGSTIKPDTSDRH